MQRRTDPSGLQATSDWAATRDEGLLRLSMFSHRAGTVYSAGRNYDLGRSDRHNVSVLSPYIRHRLIAEDEVAGEVLRHHDLRAADKFIQELCWRTYWKGWLETRPQIWDRYLSDLAALRAEADGSGPLGRAVAAAQSGATGLRCFDSWAEELTETGYLHNHARMWFASIWIYTLNLPWQLGADLFMRHLLDGDAASNTLSWRWMCGLHTPGKTYLARASNIAEFTKGRFPNETGLAEQAPALTDSGPPVSPIPLATAGEAPGGPAVLIVTEDDLNPETLPLGAAEVYAVVILDKGAEPGMADRVRRFKLAALDDVEHRAQQHFWCMPVRLAISDADAAHRIAGLAAGRSLLMAEAAVGPVRDALAPLRARLAGMGHPICPIRRDWDAAFWPYATRGYFQLKDNIPAALKSLGLIR
jgi:deoxyribodipyrimidine photo-lyase